MLGCAVVLSSKPPQDLKQYLVLVEDSEEKEHCEEIDRLYSCLDKDDSSSSSDAEPAKRPKNEKDEKDKTGKQKKARYKCLVSKVFSSPIELIEERTSTYIIYQCCS